MRRPSTARVRVRHAADHEVKKLSSSPGLPGRASAAISQIPGPAQDISDATRRDAGLSDPDLWLRYFELGGMGTPADVVSFLDGAPQSSHDHDVLAHALNERFSELGRDHPVPYADADR